MRIEFNPEIDGRHVYEIVLVVGAQRMTLRVTRQELDRMIGAATEAYEHRKSITCEIGL